MSAPHPLADALDRGLAGLSLELPAPASALLLRYIDELERWNSAYNLTAIRDPREMVVRHLLDSLALLPVLRACSGFPDLRLIDVGSGAGLPGIPLAIAQTELAVTVLDSNGKKARFMRHAVRTLALTNVEVVEARAEDWQADGGYDLVVSRAFSALQTFFGDTAHLLAPGGQWIAMKGKLDAAELAAVPTAVDIRETRRLRVPGLDEERHVVIAATPP